MRVPSYGNLQHAAGGALSPTGGGGGVGPGAGGGTGAGSRLGPTGQHHAAVRHVSGGVREHACLCWSGRLTSVALGSGAYALPWVLRLCRYRNSLATHVRYLGLLWACGLRRIPAQDTACKPWTCVEGSCMGSGRHRVRQWDSPFPLVARMSKQP